MPPLAQDPAGFTRVRYKWATGDTGFGCGHDMLVTGGPVQGDVDRLANDVATAWEPNMMANISSDITLETIEVWYSDGTTYIVGTKHVNGPGTNSAGLCPLNSSIVASLLTDEHYRGGHGRTYLPAPPKNKLLTDRSWDPAYQANVATGWAAYLEALNAITDSAFPTVTPGVIHRIRGGAELHPHRFAPYTGSRVQLRVCSQRRRLGRLI